MNESSLFRSLPARSGRMTIIFTASVFAHTCFVGLGAMWQAPAAEVPHGPDAKHFTIPKIPTEVVLTEYVPGPVIVVNTTAPTPAVEIEPPVPVAAPMKIEPQPSEDIPDMSPPPPARHAPATVVRSTSRAVPQSVSTNQGLPASNTQASAGPGGPGGSATLGWHTPKPPYPRSQVLARVQGSTTVRFTTDALGNVASVSIVKSTGNAALDASTMSYVRANWTGPANSSRTTEFVYEIR